MAKYRSYKRFNNWNSENGTYYNGKKEQIRNPEKYFESVGRNRYGYNSSYENGRGEKIYNPYRYFKAVGEDRYGFNGTRKKRK